MLLSVSVPCCSRARPSRLRRCALLPALSCSRHRTLPPGPPRLAASTALLCRPRRRDLPLTPACPAISVAVPCYSSRRGLLSVRAPCRLRAHPVSCARLVACARALATKPRCLALPPPLPPRPTSRAATPC